MTAPAHPEVISLLETYLELARENSFSHVAISMVGHHQRGVLSASDFAGEIRLEDSQLESMKLLSGRLQKSIDGWTPPARDKSLDASYVLYNVAHGPLGHDFLYWLVNAEMTRRREGAPAPLKVAFYIGNDPDIMKKDNRLHWMNNLFRPALALIGAVEDDKALLGREDLQFVPRPAVEAYKRGETVPIFNAPASTGSFVATLPKDYVTITLREIARSAERNSTLHEWVAFADYLRKKGETVIIVRDTAMAYEKLGDFQTCPSASINLHCRMALYENAKANLFTSNGPAVLAVYSAKPWLQFIRLQPQENGWVDTPNFWEQTIGIPIGSQHPWSADNQRIVWKDDTCENIVAAWEEHIVPALPLAA